MSEHIRRLCLKVIYLRYLTDKAEVTITLLFGQVEFVMLFISSFKIDVNYTKGTNCHQLGIFMILEKPSDMATIRAALEVILK